MSSSALEALWKSLFRLYLYLIGTLANHEQVLQKRLNERKLQIQGCTFQEVKALDAILEDNAKKHCMKLIDERAQHKREYDSWVNGRQMQTTKEKVDMSKALDASSVDTESSRTKSKEQDTSSRSGNDAHDDDVDIRPIYDEELIAEVQTTAKINVFVIGQQHTEQPEFNNEVTTHYLPKEREAASAKPHHMIASSNSRISSKNMLRFSSSDMVYNHYLEEANKKTQEHSRNSQPSLMPSARSQSTANGHRFSNKKTCVVQKKTMTSRSCLRWKLTGRIFKTVGLRWVPTGKIFASSTTKVNRAFAVTYDGNVIKSYVVVDESLFHP
nr:hypothetical protein [Tanacetum cinerariifolium]